MALGGEPNIARPTRSPAWSISDPGTSEVVVVDPVKRAVIRRYRLYPANAPPA